MDSQIAKKNQSLTTAEEMRNQTKLVMQPYANWEEYLAPVPLSIAILGELVFIASKTDFSINKNPPKDGYKFIRYPDSFRACLMQVCNSGWGAFNEAHKNMDQIRLHTMTVPDYMKTAVKILFQGNDEVVQAHLPDQLENIRVIADDCLDLANSTEKRFTDVINIIQELLEACVNAEHFYGEELDAITKKLEETKLRKQSSEEARKRSEKAMNTMEHKLEEAHESYKEAMDSMPSGWGMTDMDIVGGYCWFTDVINIIQELQEACVNAEHFHGEELDAITKKLEEAKLRKQSSEEARKCSEKAMNTMEHKLEEAHKSYKEAMDSMPGGWGMIVMDVVGGLTESVTSLVNGVTAVITQPVTQHCNASTRIYDTMNEIRGQESAIDAVDAINIYSKSAEILTYTEQIHKFVQDNTINWKELYDQKRKATETVFQENQFERITESLEQIPDCKAKEDAQKICDEGIAICTKLAKYAPEGKCEDAKTKKLIERIRKLTESARTFDSKSKDVTKSPALTPTPPMMYKEESKSEKMSASQRASENARFKIEQNHAQLNKTREIYDKCVENMEKNQKELTEILITLRNCKVKEIDFKTTIEMLVNGMDAMGKVKEQWEKMVRFFQMVSNIVKTRLTSTLKDFVSTSEKTQSLSYNAKLFSKDLLYKQTFQASNIASLVHMISATYTDVSAKHLMDCVSSLGKLMAMDKEKPEFEVERQQLQNSCDEAQKAILRLVLKNKEEFERKSIARMEKIDKELLAILPAAAPEEMKSIEEAVKSGFAEEEESDYI